MIPVKAAAGALVRHLHTRQPLPQIGGDEDPILIDETNIHWGRLLRDGDIVPIKPASKSRTSSSKDDQA